MDTATLKNKRQITRDDITKLLKSIGKPGDKQEEKIAAVKSLERKSRQGYDVSETLHSYKEF